MSVTDTREGFQQPVAFVPLMRQPNLPHQFDLRYCLVKTRIRPVCNCGWVGFAFRPEDKDGSAFARIQYQDHLVDVQVTEILASAT